MKTYEDFLVFLEEHLNHITDFIEPTDKDFFSVCTATARFLLSEPYRWRDLMKNWPQIPTVEKPSESQLIDFFTTTKGLKLSFRKELKENNLGMMYDAYTLLFPTLVLKDEFLSSVFRQDLQARRYKKIFLQHQKKITRVMEFINRMKEDDNFLELMETFTADLSGFSLTIINNKKLLDQVVNKLACREN